MRKKWFLFVGIFLVISIFSAIIQIRSASLVAFEESTVTERRRVADAIVFIVAGDLTAGPAASMAIEALRRLGRWDGPIVIVTDRPACLRDLNANFNYDVTLVEVALPAHSEDPSQWLLAVKGLKCRLFPIVDASPAVNSSNWSQMLYLDLDVWTTRPLTAFFRSAAALLSHTSVATPWLVVFADAGAHTLRFCSGCDRWNTGVMLFGRSKRTQVCLSHWLDLLRSGKHDTDQGALEAVVAGRRECSAVATLPSRHMLFMKDYFFLPLVPLLGWPTFCHVTSANHITDQDWFYRQVASRLHASLGLHSALYAKLSPDEMCS